MKWNYNQATPLCTTFILINQCNHDFIYNFLSILGITCILMFVKNKVFPGRNWKLFILGSRNLIVSLIDTLVDDFSSNLEQQEITRFFILEFKSLSSPLCYLEPYHVTLNACNHIYQECPVHKKVRDKSFPWIIMKGWSFLLKCVWIPVREKIKYVI